MVKDTTRAAVRAGWKAWALTATDVEYAPHLGPSSCLGHCSSSGLDRTAAIGHAASADPALGLRAVASLRLLAEQLESLNIGWARHLG